MIHLGQSTDPALGFEALYRGAQSALEAFPAAGSRLRGPGFGLPAWELRPGASPVLAIRIFREDDPTERIQEFLGSPFRLAKEAPLRQMVLGTGEPPEWRLVTQVHHAASDLIGTLLFMQRQLQVAHGAGAPPLRPQRTPPALREAAKGARRNPESGVSTALATRSGPRSATRDFRTLAISREPLASLAQTVGGFRWNDCLLAAALDALAAWNERQGAPADRIGLWVPTNIREERLAGFGNGASRIRIHREPVTTAKRRAFLERCRSVRRIVHRKKHRGEWTVPALPGPEWLFPVAAPFLGRWLDRRWADFGTAGFTHLEHWPGDGDPILDHVSGMEVIACLHRRHPLYFAAMSQGDETAVTITWDPALLRDEDIDFIADAFEAPLVDPPFARSGVYLPRAR